MKNLSEKKLEQLDEFKALLYDVVNKWTKGKQEDEELIEGVPFVFLQIFAEGAIARSGGELSKEDTQEYHETLDHYLEVTKELREEYEEDKGKAINLLKEIESFLKKVGIDS